MFSFPQSPGAGLVAAVMIAIVPGYISRSVAGSYDNEGRGAVQSCWMIHEVFYSRRATCGKIKKRENVLIVCQTSANHNFRVICAMTMNLVS